MTRAALRSALGVAAPDDPLFYDLLGHPLFIEVDSRRWGLVDRDLPGGPAAYEAAERAIRETRPRSPHAAAAIVRAIGGIHAEWTDEMAASVYRAVKLGN